MPLGKKSTKRAVFVLAVLFGVRGWSGSKFGFVGPKFYGEPEAGFGSVGSARVRALPDIFVLGGNSRFRCTTLNLIADLDSTQFFGSCRIF